MLIPWQRLGKHVSKETYWKLLFLCSHSLLAAPVK
jgi:hypothetical protein